MGLAAQERARAAAPSGAAALADLLATSERAVVLTGAGISVPSGIPDFRSPGTGIWEDVDPIDTPLDDQAALKLDGDVVDELGALAVALARRGDEPSPPVGG